MDDDCRIEDKDLRSQYICMEYINLPYANSMYDNKLLKILSHTNKHTSDIIDNINDLNNLNDPLSEKYSLIRNIVRSRWTNLQIEKCRTRARAINTDH